MVHTVFWSMIFRKIIKIVATSLKCTKLPGLCPRPVGGAYSASSDPLAGFKGPTSKGRQGREGRGREARERTEGNVEFHHQLVSN